MTHLAKQWLAHAAIGLGWGLLGSSIIWLDVGVLPSVLAGFVSALAGATMKEGTDQTVFAALQKYNTGNHTHQGKLTCERLGWVGWDWLDFAQHLAGGAVGPWLHVLAWWLVT